MKTNNGHKTMLNLLIVLSPFILIALSLIILFGMELMNWVEDNSYSFSDMYKQCQHDIKCKKAHDAGMLAGAYYSDEYKAAYRAVMNGDILCIN